MKSSVHERLSLKKIKHDNVKREYLLYVPRSYSDDVESPMVLNFHGYGGTALGQLYYSDWRDLSDQYGFILIYPQGLELQKGGSHWNPEPISKESKSSSKDLGFINKLIKKISRKYSFDKSRLYATGFSNGAGMAYGLAHHESESIAGIAPVSGLMNESNLSTISDISPVGVISFNGNEDWVRPIGGIDGYLAPIIKTSRYWAQVNHSPSSKSKKYKRNFGNHVNRTSYFRKDGSTTIEQYIIKKGGHEWFDLNIGGRNLNQLAWDFLSKLSKKEGELLIEKGNTFNIYKPDKFKYRSIDKIINFNSANDSLGINTDSFSIDRSATFASGINKKNVEQMLATQDYDFLYDKKKGGIYFNENGANKGFGDGGIIAILSGAPELMAEHIAFL